jgi:hypothetical protein
MRICYRPSNVPRCGVLVRVRSRILFLLLKNILGFKVLYLSHPKVVSQLQFKAQYSFFPLLLRLSWVDNPGAPKRPSSPQILKSNYTQDTTMKSKTLFIVFASSLASSTTFLRLSDPALFPSGKSTISPPDSDHQQFTGATAGDEGDYGGEIAPLASQDEGAVALSKNSRGRGISKSLDDDEAEDYARLVLNLAKNGDGFLPATDGRRPRSALQFAFVLDPLSSPPRQRCH